jgi:uncharacterized membrane protein YdjX (TVP38/TMEM64 family)
VARGDGHGLGRLAALFLAVVAVLLVVFAVAESAGIGVLTDPRPTLASLSGPAAAVVGVGLLTADIVLPVPSSVVMVALGALYGVAVGTALATIGGVAAALLGGLLGRQGHRALDRVVGGERGRVEAMLDRYGVAAVIVTRPVPLLAESVVLIAGAAGMPMAKLVAGALIGSLPVAFVYAVAGARGRQAVGAVAFVVLVAVSITALVISLHRSGVKP